MIIVAGLLHGGTSIVTAHLKMHDKIEMFIENQNMVMQPKYYQILEDMYIKEGKLLGNKMLSNQLWWPKKEKIEVIVKSFKCNKYIFIFRDPRDFMLSGRDDRDHSFEDSIKTWNYYVRRAFEFIDKRHYTAYYFKFEDFIMYPEAHCKAICSLLEIDFQPKMMDFYMYEEQFRKKYGNKIDLSRMYPWKRHEDQEFMKRIGKRFDPEAMKRIGYER